MTRLVLASVLALLLVPAEPLAAQPDDALNSANASSVMK